MVLFFSKFSPVNLGCFTWELLAGKLSATAFPPKSPRPTGPYGTIPIPRNLQSGTISSSMSRVHREYSSCTAVIG
nr:hypothetical protein Iba_chr04aCG20680 [Ipomoea batatas]GMC87042.1 hypothetical protein Iba_chr04dCG16500 [Ipomoea batatas]GMC91033.1 hypothetical protein Iba_chr04fCG13560 [Ipomoea batatas]